MRVLILSLVLAGPTAAGTGEVVRDHIRPGFQAFAVAAEAHDGIESCETEALRPAFQSVLDAWMGVAHLTPGPAEEDRRGLSVLFWPDPEGSGRKARKPNRAA